MDSDLAVILIVIMLVFSALFSASETAFSSVNRIRLKNLAAQGNKTAVKTLKIAESFDKTLTAILIGNNIVNIASSAIGTVLFTRLFPENGVLISTGAMTLLVLLFGEILPKSFAKENAEKVALFFTEPLSVLVIILMPVIWIFSKLTAFVSKLLSAGAERPSVTEEELKHIIEEIEEEGVLEEQESDLVRSALEFDEIRVDRILIPRVHIVGVEINTPIEEIKNIFLSEMYSRLPVFEKSIDNIIGIITEKDFFRLLIEGGEDIGAIVQNTIHFSEFKLISEALKEMQHEKMHMAVVLDQHGGTKGIITLEDVIEELVGDIYDENDEVEELFSPAGDGAFDVDAELSISDLLEKLGLSENAIECSSNTVGGWVLDLLGHIAKNGETVQSGDFSITVTETDEQKINKIRLSVAPRA